MGIVERKEREKQEMRDRILESAMALFVEHGFEKTSIRRIADAIEYSPATIYLYFKDKSEIFYELHRMAFMKFGQEFRKAVLIEDPFERLRFIGRVYINFALDNPQHYDLMFVMRAPMDCIHAEKKWEAGKATFSVLEETVRECLDRGLIQGKDYRFVSYSLWGHVHGLVSLALRERLRMYGETDGREHILASNDEMMDMLRR